MRVRISIRAIVFGCAIISTAPSRIFAETTGESSTIRLTGAEEPATNESTTVDRDEPPRFILEPTTTSQTARSPVPQQALRRANSTVSQTSFQQSAPRPLNQPRRTVDFYAARNASQRMSQMPRQAAFHTSMVAPANPRRPKPFESVRAAPTISPYLHLERDERENQSLPTWFGFVRPQLDQQEADAQQQQQLEQIRRQLQNSPQSISTPQQAGATRGPAQYMNTAQYYRGMR